jgi:hypothetical protein
LALLGHRIADQRLVILDDRDDVPQPDRSAVIAQHGLPVRPLQGHGGEVGRLGYRQDVVYAEPLVGRVDKAAGPGRGRLDEAQRRDPKGVR